MRKHIYFFALLLFCFQFNPAFLTAGVNLKNGNFFITYTDHSFKGNNSISIDRTYNSKSTILGLFGFGWGSEFETHLFISGDGTLYIREFGGGGVTVFRPAENNELLITEAINAIAKAAVQKGNITSSPSAISSYKRLLQTDEEKRRNEWERYVKEGLLTNPALQTSSRWNSEDRGSQWIEFTASGFKRSYSNGSYQLFTSSGYLSGKFDKYNQSFYTIRYSSAQQISSITDGAGHLFEISFNKDSLISEIKSSNGVSFYQYENKRLVYSKDTGDNIYRYGYDNNFNMTAVHYSDGTSMLVEYDNVTGFVSKITERNGTSTAYIYKTFYDEQGKIDNNHYATWVIKQSTNRNSPDSNYYEYEIKKRTDGSSYTYRIIQQINNRKTETIYSENCGNPLQVKTSAGTTYYDYNNSCNLILKETDTYISKAEYNEKNGKITRTIYRNKETGDSTVNTFTYNNNGDLLRATENEKWVQLTYNNDNKIVKMEYEDGILEFDYNSKGKPIRIAVSGKGEINVTYDNEGQILKTESPGGSGIALQVTQAMQALLARTKPKGLDYN